MNVINPGETYIDREWVMKYDTQQKRDILDGKLELAQRATINIIEPKTSVGNGWYKIKVRIIASQQVIDDILSVMDKINTKPFTFYYKQLSTMQLQNTIEIAKSIVKIKHNYIIDKYVTNVEKKTVYILDDNGNNVYINDDSIYLDTYKNYKPIFDFTVANNKLIKYVMSQFGYIQYEIVDNVYVVDQNFDSDEIIDKINNMLIGMIDNNFCYNDGQRYAIVASRFGVKEYYPNVYKCTGDTEFSIHGEDITVTLGSYGDNYQFTLYNAGLIYYKLFKEFTIIYVLSDGAIRIKLNDMKEIERFKKKMNKYMGNDIEVESVKGGDIDRLIELRNDNKVNNVFSSLGKIGDTYYLTTMRT